MANSLTHTQGKAWQPLLDEALTELSADGVAVESVWESPDERAAALKRLRRLLDLVVTWNARVDLTAARDARELVDLYLVDAVVLAAHAGKKRDGLGAERWLDVGSGAGAPGLVLALIRPDLELTLVEPRAKRVAFLRTAVGSLALRRPAIVLDRRSDALPAASCDVAVSRATFAPDVWLCEGARLAQSAVWVLLARAESPALPGWCVARQVDYRWPLTGAVRRAVEFVRESAPSSS